MAALRADVDLGVNTRGAKRSMQKAANEINKITGGVAGKEINFNVNGKSFTQPLGRITSSANEFTKSLEASNARVIAFGASVGIINGITDSFKYLVTETIRFEKTLKDINVVLNASNAQLKQFGEGLFDVAQNTAQGFNIAADAALEFSRQGLSTEEVLKRTNDALTLTRITSLDAADAVSGLTAAVNAFGKTGLTTTDIIDKLAAVDVKFAVSSEDLINGLERAGAVAIDAGVSLDSLIGIITSLQQTTARGGAVIGNGLKTIFTRIQRPESIRQLEAMDLRVRDLTGAILPADTILKNIAKSFKDLTQAQQSNVVQFSAGIFQANIFRAALGDLAKAQGVQQQALGISANAAGEAARKNELLNKSISALASRAGTGIQELVGIMGELTVKDDIGGILDVFGKSIEGLKNALGGGEKEGNTFAKGLVRGIGNILTGPGMIAFVAIFSKLLLNVFKFAGGSLKDVLGIVSQKEKVKNVEEAIVRVLGSNKQITESLNNLEGDRLAQEKFILGVIEAQTNAMAQQQRLARVLAGPLVNAGIDESLSVTPNSGHYQDVNRDGIMQIGAAGVNPEAARREKKGAAEGGYAPGPIAQTKVPGVGNVVYNKAETIKQFPGMKQPAIMPPQKSRAGRNYGRAFGERHGFDPYASGGFVPNFFNQSTWGANDPRYKGPKGAQLSGTMLKLPPAKMMVETTKQDPNTNKKMVGWHYLEAAYRNIGNMKTIKESGLDAAFGGLNVTALGRAVYHSSEDLPNPKYPNKYQASGKAAGLQRAARRGTRRQRRNADNIAGSAYEGTLFDKSLKGQEYNETWKGEYDKDGNYIKGDGDKDANIDFFKMDHIPLEAKFGAYKDPNVMGKSIKLSSDSYIEDFLRANGQGGAAEAMMAIKRGASIEVLKKLGRGEDELEASGLSRGFVPNFLSATNSLSSLPGATSNSAKLSFLSSYMGTGSSGRGVPGTYDGIIDAENFMGRTEYFPRATDINLGGAGSKTPVPRIFLQHGGINDPFADYTGLGLNLASFGGSSGRQSPHTSWPDWSNGSIQLVQNWRDATSDAISAIHGSSSKATYRNIRAELSQYSSGKGTSPHWKGRLGDIHGYDPTSKAGWGLLGDALMPDIVSGTKGLPGNQDLQKRMDANVDDLDTLVTAHNRNQTAHGLPTIKTPYGLGDFELVQRKAITLRGRDIGGGPAGYQFSGGKYSPMSTAGMQSNVFDGMSVPGVTNTPLSKANLSSYLGNSFNLRLNKYNVTDAAGNLLPLHTDVNTATGLTLNSKAWESLSKEINTHPPFKGRWGSRTTAGKHPVDLMGKSMGPADSKWGPLASRSDDHLANKLLRYRIGSGGGNASSVSSNLGNISMLDAASQGLIPNFSEEDSKGSLPELKYIDLYKPTHHRMNRDGSTAGLQLPFNFDMHKWSSMSGGWPDDETSAKLHTFLAKANSKVYNELPGGKSFFGPEGKYLHRSFRSKEGVAAHYANSFHSAMKDMKISKATKPVEPGLLAQYLPKSYYYKHRMPEQIFKGLNGRFDGPYAVVDESKIGMNNRMLGSWTTEGPSNRKTFDVKGLMENYNFIDTMGGSLEAERPGITQALRTNTLMKGPSGMTDGIDLDSGLLSNKRKKGKKYPKFNIAGGLIPNFARGVFDFDKMDKVFDKEKDKMVLPGKQRNYILDKIMTGNIPYDVVHGVPAAGKSTWAQANWPGAKNILSGKDFDSGNWTEFAVLAGQGPSRTSRKDQPKGFLQYSDQARALFAGARDIFAMTPGEEELTKRRQNRMQEAEEGRLPDNRSAKELAASAVRGRGDIVRPDYDLYDQLEDKGKDVWRMKALGLVPNFVRYDKSGRSTESWEAIPDNRVGRYGGSFTGVETEKMRNDGWAFKDGRWKFVGGGRAGVDYVEKEEREARRKLAEAQGVMRGGGKMIVDNKTGKMYHGTDHQRIAEVNNLYEDGGLPFHFLKTHMSNKNFDSRVDGGKGGFARKMFVNLREKTINAEVLSKLKGIAEENAMVLLRDDMHSSDREGDVLYDSRGVLGEAILSSGFIPNFATSELDEYARKELIGKKFMDLSRMVTGMNISGAIGPEERRFKQAIFGALAPTFPTPPSERGPGTGWNPLIKAENWANISAESRSKLSGYLTAAAGSGEKDPDKKMWKDMMRRRGARGLVPNFAGIDVYRGMLGEKGKKYTKSDVFGVHPKRKNQFRSSSIYDIGGLKDYLLGHVDNQQGSSLVSTSTREGRAREFAISKDSSTQGYMSKENMSFRRIYNPRKVEKLIHHLMERKGWSEAKSVQWFLENAKNKKIGFHMKRWMDEGSALQDAYSFEDEVGLLGKDAFAKSDNLAIASRGVVPNFSNPLSNAIKREKAAGVPSGKIRVSQSNQLKGPANPMGLAVTNTRDEPAGIAQGIKRARERGIDPKRHGAAKGMVPNFASSGTGDIPKIEQINKFLEAFVKTGVDGIEEMRSDLEKLFPNLQGVKDWLKFFEKIKNVDPKSPESMSLGAKKIDKAIYHAEEDLKKLDSQVEGGTPLTKEAESWKSELEKVLPLLKDIRDGFETGSVIQETTKDKESLVKGGADFKREVDEILKSLEKKHKETTDTGEQKNIQKEHDAIVKERNDVLRKEKEIIEESTEAKAGDMAKLFFMSSMIQMVNGQFQELATSSSNVVANFGKLAEGAANVVQAQITAKELGGQVMESMGGSEESSFSMSNIFSREGRESSNEAFRNQEMERRRNAGPARGLGRILGPIGRVGRLFTRFIPIVGQLYTGFTMFNEVFKLFNDGEGIMSLFDSGADKARKKIEKLGKASEAAAAALESMEKLEKTKVKLAELEILGGDRTIKQEGELLSLQLETLKLEQKQAESITALTNKQKTGEFGAKLLSDALAGTANSLGDQKEALEEVTLRLQAMAAVASINVGFGENMDQAETKEGAAALARVHGANFAALSANKFGDDPAQVQGIAKYLTKVLDTDLKQRPELMDSDYDFYNAIDRINTTNLSNLGMDINNAQILKDEFRLMYDAVQDEDRTAIDEDKTMAVGIKSFINTMTKGMDISGNMQKLVESTGKARKELERRVEMGKALRAMQQKELSHGDEMRKLGIKERDWRNNLLKEHKLISNAASIERDMMLKQNELDIDIRKKRRDAESKLTEALLEQAQKAYRVENLAGMNETDVDEAMKNLRESLDKAAGAVNDPNVLRDLNKGLLPGSQVKASQTEKSQAKKILGDLAEAGKTTSGTELQAKLNEVFFELEAAGSNNVALLVQMALAISGGIPISEEELKVKRKALLEQEGVLHAIQKDKEQKLAALKQEEKKKEVEGKTLKGAIILLEQFGKKIVTQESINKDMLGEAANQKVINDSSSRRVELLRGSEYFQAQIFESLRKEAQESAEKEQASSAKLDQSMAIRDLTRSNNLPLKLDETGKNLLKTDVAKVSNEIKNLHASRKELEFRNASLAHWSSRKTIANETFLTEKENQENEILNNHYSQEHLKSSELRSEVAKRALILEVQGLEKESTLLDGKLELMKNIDYQAYISQGQVNSELKQLKYDNILEKAKFAYSLHSGKLEETARETLESEILNLEKDALITASKNRQLSANEGLEKRQKRAQELLDMGNKLQELKNAEMSANVDQGTLSAIVDANMQIKMFSQRRGVREAALTARDPRATPEDMLSFTEQLKEFNRTTGEGSGAIDQLRIKMAEMSLSASNLGSDLVDIGIEGARSGMVQLFKDIGTGAEGATEAWKKFALGLAESILDRMMQHNVDKIINDLTYAFTGVDPEKEAQKFLRENTDHLKALTEALERRTKSLEDETRGDVPKPEGDYERGLARIKGQIDDIEHKHMERIADMHKSSIEIMDAAKPSIENATNGVIDALNGSLKMVADKLNAEKVALRPIPPDGSVSPSGQKPKTFVNPKTGKPLVFDPEPKDANTIDPSKDILGLEFDAVSKKDQTERRASLRLELIEARRKAEENPLTARIHPSVIMGGLSASHGLKPSPQIGGKRPGQISGNDYWKRLWAETANSSNVDPESSTLQFGMRPSRHWKRFDATKYDVNDPGSFEKFKDATGKARFQLLGQMRGAEEAVSNSARKEAGFREKLGAKGVSFEQSEKLDESIKKEVAFQKKFTDLRNQLFNEYEQLGSQFLEIRKELKARLDNQRTLQVAIDPETQGEKIDLQADLKKLQVAKENIKNTTFEDQEEIVDAANITLKDFNVKATNAKDVLHLFAQEIWKLKDKINNLPESSPLTETIPENFWGGRIQKFAEGGFVTGPAGRDQVPAMLTAGEYVVPKDEAQKFAPGGKIRDALSELNNKDSDNRYVRGAQGIVRAVTMHETSRLMRDAMNKKQDKPPTFNMNKLDQLNLGSDVSMKRGDSRLSSKFLADDPVMEEYRGYLMDKAAYNVQKKNEKFKDKQSLAGAIIGAFTSFMTAEAVGVAKPYLKRAVDWGKAKVENTVKGHMGFGKHSDAFKSGRAAGLDFDYRDIKAYDRHIDLGNAQMINPGLRGVDSSSNQGYYRINTMREKRSFWLNRRIKGPDGQMAFDGGVWDDNDGNSSWTRNDREETSYRTRVRQAHEREAIRRQDRKITKRNRGGSIPAMLTAGEGFIPASTAKRIGYGNLNAMNKTGSLPIIQGRGGVDNVGPVGLSEGDFIIRKSSTDKLMKENPNMMRFALQNPDGFKRGETGYYEGGIVGTDGATSISQPGSTGSSSGQPVNRIQPLMDAAQAQQKEKVTHSQNNEVTNNINVNVTIDGSGNERVEAESTQGSYEQEQALAMKIKSSVLEVIREEKRLGGELDR
jgi:TP901 family phage tail tape measure protein